MEGHPAYVAGLEPISEAQMQVRICRRPAAGYRQDECIQNQLMMHMRRP